jgi:uncharacterized protein (DUF488 family)
VKHLLDVRVNNTSQLAGFTKKEDLKYFLKSLINVDYHEARAFAPEESMMKDYRKTGDWQDYEKGYLSLIKSRQAEKSIDRRLLEEGAVLLCSEATAEHCHRRLAAEYLANHLKPEQVEIVHL